VTENVNLRVELSHLTLLTITDFFSHIICQIILFMSNLTMNAIEKNNYF
jgi:hypothetical protein